MNKPVVSIIIPNLNGYELLKKYLSFVVEVKGVDEMIVVDDHSTDDSISFIEKNFPLVKTVKKEKQEGFASAVNTGVGYAKGDIVVLLNTDVKPEKNCIMIGLPYFDDKNVFAVGFLDRSHEKEKIIERGRGIAKWTKGFYIHAKGSIDANDTAWVSGGSGMFRKEVWMKLGGMDTLYNPFYWEDIDLSYRARKAGYTLRFSPTSIVDHYHEQGTIKKNSNKRRIQQIAFRNQFQFIWKNCSTPSIILAHILWTPIRCLQNLLQGNIDMTVGFFLAFFRLPLILLKRMHASRFWKKSDVLLSETP